MSMSATFAFDVYGTLIDPLGIAATLMRDYRDSPTCTREALESLKTQHHRVYAFSNGHPAVYQHFLDITGATQHDTWLVSGNPFDVVGAHAAGWTTVWVKCDAAEVFDPWGVDPTVTIADLRELNAVRREMRG